MNSFPGNGRNPRGAPSLRKFVLGRSLKPAKWPGGATCAVALSFDSDHETTTLRWGDNSPGTLSANQYGARVAIPPHPGAPGEA